MASDPIEVPAGESSLNAPLAGSRSQAVQRLQIGLFGLGAMLLLVGLANVVINNARENEAGVVPDAAPTVEASVPTPRQSETINVPDIEAP
jgi:hypothetical protein